ncbi:gametocyte-specific factor 1 [Elysia marginata]|uniref:Gametocyte-specific factor 1 n=1 Tax=Elysia marginata TaxID=1093978 RepID=A0AAV4FF38_9GAST|nr:gametocyte-specific factor 1 [Elysia marginata]
MGEEVLVCPYDSSHIISVLRMPRHLLKCRKNYPFVDMAVCPFNGFHEVPPPELRYHMEHCPDKALLDRDVQLDLKSTRMKGFTELPKTRKFYLQNEDSEEELWDSEQLENASSFQRNRARNRQRDEENIRLRMPKRGGTAARLASSLQALEISGNQYRADNSASTQTASHKPRSSTANSSYQPDRYAQQYAEADYDDKDSVHRESLSSLKSSRLCHTSSADSTSTLSLSSDCDVDTVNKSLTNTKKCDPDRIFPNCTTSSIPESTPSPPSQADLPQSSRIPERCPSAVKSQPFMLGRGRAMSTFNLKSDGLEPCGVGRGNITNFLAAAAQTEQLRQLARSLGRGRGIGLQAQQASNATLHT